MQSVIHDSRRLKEIIGLGLANGVFMGAGLLSKYPVHAALAAFGASGCITLAYLFISASKQA